MRIPLYLILISALAACSGGSKSPADVSEVLLKDIFPLSGDALQWSLKATNETELKSYLEKTLVSADKIQIVPPILSAVGLPIATSAGLSGAKSSSTPSQTTLQEAGVDEADLVKADASFIYSIDPLPNSEGRLLLNRHKLGPSSGNPNLSLSDSLRLGFSKGVQGSSLYLDSDRKQIAAIGTQSSGWSYGRMPVIDWFAPTAWRNGATEVVLVNAPTSGSLKPNTANQAGWSFGWFTQNRRHALHGA